MAAARASVADISARSAARTASPPKPCRARFPRPSLVAAIIFPHTKWLPRITDYRGTAALIFASSTLKQLTIRGSFTGAVRNTLLYPKFNGSHFGLPPSSSCIKWLDWVAQWCERWRMRSGPFKGQCHDIQWFFALFPWAKNGDCSRKCRGHLTMTARSAAWTALPPKPSRTNVVFRGLALWPPSFFPTQNGWQKTPIIVTLPL